MKSFEALRGVDRVALAGSIRRGKETAGDIDILATAADPSGVMAAFADLPQVAAILERGHTRASVRHRDGIQVDLRVVEPESFGAALQYFTGSAQHNIRIREMANRRGPKVSEATCTATRAPRTGTTPSTSSWPRRGRAATSTWASPTTAPRPPSPMASPGRPCRPISRRSAPCRRPTPGSGCSPGPSATSCPTAGWTTRTSYSLGSTS